MGEERTFCCCFTSHRFDVTREGYVDLVTIHEGNTKVSGAETPRKNLDRSARIFQIPEAGRDGAEGARAGPCGQNGE